MKRNNQAKENLEALSRYEYGALAGDLIRTNPSLASQSLMLLNENLNDDKGTRNLMQEFVYSNERGIKKAIEVYAGEYEKALGSSTIGELSSNYYENTLEGLAEEDDLVTINDELEKFDDDTLENIEKKVEEANYDLVGASKGYRNLSEKEIKELENTIEKYVNVVSILGVLRGAKLESLRPNVAERSYQISIKGIAEKIRDSQ